MKLNANHSLYLWKTLLTKSAVAGFQLWVSSLAAFCLANRRFSLLRDKEVDVRWLVLVLGCQLITCSDARQGSRSSPSTVSCFAHAAMLLFGAVFGTPFVKISMAWWGLVVQADRSSSVSLFYFYDAPAWRIHLNCYAPFWKITRHWRGRANNLKLWVSSFNTFATQDAWPVSHTCTIDQYVLYQLKGK